MSDVCTHLATRPARWTPFHITKAGAKTFILQYRNAAGKSRRINMGRYGIVTLKNARAEAKIKLGAIAAGEDPVSHPFAAYWIPAFGV